MKCPMMKEKEAWKDVEGNEHETVELQECIEAECAWWLAGLLRKECAITVIARLMP